MLQSFVDSGRTPPCHPPLLLAHSTLLVPSVGREGLVTSARPGQEPTDVERYNKTKQKFPSQYFFAQRLGIAQQQQS